MKYILLPVHLVKFWYFESLVVFLRTWRNTILFLEEDLAVGLMLRLLFVPLFHDFSCVGRILSFIFRVIRIFTGLLAFIMATLLLMSLSLVWFSLPILLVLGVGEIYAGLLIFAGVGIFLIHTFSHPHKKVWSNDLWASSWIPKNKFTFEKILMTTEVKLFLQYLENSPENFTNFKISNVEDVGLKAFELAKKTGSDYIGPTHFFVAALKLSPNLDEFLLKFNLTEKDLEDNLEYLQKRKNNWRVVWIWDQEFAVHHLRGTNRGWLGVPTPILDSVSIDLTREAARGAFENFLGRASVISTIVNILSQDNHKNVILVGSPGVGKTSIVNFLASKIVSGDAPPSLATKRLVALDFTKLLSGVENQGDLASRVKGAFEEAQYAQNIVVVMEEIHNIALGQAGAEYNLYSLLAPFLEFGNFQFLATTEPENYSRILEKNGTFARLFTKIEVTPTSDTETLEILESHAIGIERKRKIRITFLSLKKAVELSAKYIRDRVLPDSAISILEQAEGVKDWLTAKVVEEVIGTRVNVPVLELGNTEKSHLLNLEQEIKYQLIGQDLAVKVIADALRRGAVSLREGSRPIGSFLFVGPTGVGKTELAKTLAEVYFKIKGAFVWFDMSEYQGTDGVEKLIGATGEAGELTEAIRNKPYALLLLDEFEKADPKILTLFLQVLEDGRLTDGAGKTVDFTNTIIIATSNAGSLNIAEGLKEKKNIKEIEAKVREELLQIFKPELLNRFDEVVLFAPLTQESLKKIVKIKLDELKVLLQNQGYAVQFDEALLGELAKRGYDPVLGARPLRRLIQDTLEARLSRMILEGKLKKGVVYLFR